MAKKTNYTYEEICRDVRKRDFKPVYFLMGEEPFYIDKITDLLLQSVLTEDEKDFNLITLYGADVEVSDVINAVRRYPMMSDYQLVVVKEAQLISHIDLLTAYLKNPLPSTVLVINYKHKTIDKRTSFANVVASAGVLFESAQIKDYYIAGYIVSVLESESISIDMKSAQMLGDYLGNDLTKICNEIDKLKLLFPNTSIKRITPEMIEKNIGISKDYNNFELVSALIAKDKLKAMRIVDHFAGDSKKYPVQVTLSVLYNFFSNLLIAFYSKDQSENALIKNIGLKNVYQARDLIRGMRSFTAMKAFNMIGEIRKADAMSKGYDNTSTSGNELLKELIYKAMH